MLYQINDKFLVDNILCEVRHINNGSAWVSPIEDLEDYLHYSSLAFEVLDEKGFDRKGNKAIVINNMQSGAV